ncbi:hypothetical protein ACROYT_G003712 [Oculina patagonica]
MEMVFEAVKNGKTSSSEVMLKSIKQDGLLLQREASALCDRLKEAEEEHQKQAEDLTQQINDLYQVQIEHEKSKQELETKVSSLTNEKERCRQRRQDASRRKREAEREKREAEEKYEELEKYFWVPFYGQFLAIREIIENNGSKARDASREMACFESDIRKAESDIAWANSGICEAEKNINEILEKVENLKRQRDACHNELGDVKSMVSFIMQAVTFWNEVVELTKAATVKTDHIQRIVGLAAKKNTVRILKSNGTQTLMRSFKERWMEVAEMIASDDNNLVLTGTGPIPHLGARN